MPGTFTHFLSSKKALSHLGDGYIKDALTQFPSFLNAGSVAPDYPYLHYLAFSQDASDKWADRMHTGKTVDFVKVGAEVLRNDFPAKKNDERFQQSVAWLFGYFSHVLTDVTIHPIVNAIVGKYEENKTEHRRCEMYMDSYLYDREENAELIQSRWDDAVEEDLQKNNRLVGNIFLLWEKMLETTYPREYGRDKGNTFKMIDLWNQEYCRKITLVAEGKPYILHDTKGGDALFYLSIDEIKKEENREKMNKYCTELKLPKGNRRTQDDHWPAEWALDFASKKVSEYWVHLESAITGGDQQKFLACPNWSLDTGKITGTDPVPDFWI